MLAALEAARVWAEVRYVFATDAMRAATAFEDLRQRFGRPWQDMAPATRSALVGWRIAFDVCRAMDGAWTSLHDPERTS